MKKTGIFVALCVMGSAAFAQGDVAKGEKALKKCKACHSIVDDAGNKLLKGGRTGPNLWMVLGAPVASREDFTKYSKSLTAAREAGLVWTDEAFLEFVVDPSKYLKTYLDDPKAKSKMTFKLKKGGEDILAYLKSINAVALPAEQTDAATN